MSTDPVAAPPPEPSPRGVAAGPGRPAGAVARLASVLLVTAGAAGTGLFGPGLVWVARTAWSSRAGPLAVTVAEAPPRRAVRLVDAVVRCDAVRGDPGARIAIATDRAGAHAFVLPLGDAPCPAGEVAGVFLDDPTPGAGLRQQGLPVQAETVRVLMPWEAARLLRRAGTPVVIALALATAGLWLAWRRRRP